MGEYFLKYSEADVAAGKLDVDQDGVLRSAGGNGGGNGGGVFVVEVDWENSRAITPLNDIRDAWLSHKLIQVFRVKADGEVCAYTFTSGFVDGKTGNFFAAEFSRFTSDHYYYIIYITQDGTVGSDAWQIDLS